MNTGLLRHAVATVLTVYGIETLIAYRENHLYFVATVLTVYGIETWWSNSLCHNTNTVATVLTVYGIETCFISNSPLPLQLQQCLPFTVLKLG